MISSIKKVPKVLGTILLSPSSIKCTQIPLAAAKGVNACSASGYTYQCGAHHACFFLGEVKTGECSEIVSVSARGSGLAGAAPQEGPRGEGAAELSNKGSAKQHPGSEQRQGEAGGGLQEFGEEIVPNQKVGECLFLQRSEGMGKCLNVCLL